MSAVLPVDFEIREQLKQLPDFRQVGLGYRADYEQGGIRLEIDRLRDSRGELSGELAVSNAAGHIFQGRFNLSSLTARKTTSSWLADRATGVDWVGILERFCVRVLEAHRRGEPVVTIGGPERPAEQASMMLAPLVAFGKPTIIFAPGGTGKSTLAAAAAVSVQTGAEIIPSCRVLMTAPVLVLDWEDDETTWDAQIRAICRGVGIDVPKIKYRRMAGALADQVETIAELVTEHGIGFLIVDSVEAACGSHESDGYNDKANRLFDALRVIGIASLLLDHPAGADIERETPVAKPIGGIMKVNRTRAVFELKAEKEPTPERIEMVLIDTKRNRRARQAPISLAVNFSDFDDEGTAGRISYRRCEVDAPDLVLKLTKGKQILHALRGGRQSVKQLAVTLNTSESAIRTYLGRLGDQIVRLPDSTIGLARE